MTKKSASVMVSLVLLTLLLSGCKLPASQAPTEAGEAMTTPINIQTDSPISMTQTAIAKNIATATLAASGTTEPTPTNTPEPTEIVVVPTVTRPAAYTIHEGEFPYCIARRFNLNPADLLSLNGLTEGSVLSPGATLKIPQTGTWSGDGRVRNPHPTTHTVSSGETIYSIACYFGDVSPEAIIAVNHLESPYTLTSGQVLNIP
jgi:LysM repeat protein